MQVAMYKPFLRMLPRIRRVFGLMAHVRVDCHTTGANGETRGCCEFNLVSFLLENPNMQWCISVDKHCMVENNF